MRVAVIRDFQGSGQASGRDIMKKATLTLSSGPLL